MTPIRIIKDGRRWIARFPFDWETKDIVKNAGFRFDPSTKSWWTEDATIAAKLDPAAAAIVNKAIESSRAVSAAINVPAPAGLAYLPYQAAGIAYAMSRRGTLIGDEMGLGKTIEACGVINADPSIKSVLVICPASLKLNWLRELTKWLVTPRSIEIANGSFPQADVVIINWDILGKHRRAIDAREWHLLIADEVHYAKNSKALRTQALFGKWDPDPEKRRRPIVAKRRLFLTGTPIVNRPAELWTLIHALDPNDMGRSMMQFMKRYTNAVHNGYGWDFSGASNLEELQTLMRGKFLVRRLKSEVLTELPPKRRQIIVLPVNGARAAIDAERAAQERHQAAIRKARQEMEIAKARNDKEAYEIAVMHLRDALRIAFSEMSKLRHDTAVAKIPYVVEHIQECLEAEDKVVVFCHHHDVGHALKEAFPSAALVTGEIPVGRRQAEVDRFQTDPTCKVFIGSIQAAGVGLTLTAARLVVFAELDWVPGNVSQAEDRLHRIGQRGSVLVQHLVFDNSVDSRMAHIIIDKQNVIDAALDNPTAEFEATVIEAKTASVNEIELAIPDDESIPF